LRKEEERELQEHEKRGCDPGIGSPEQFIQSTRKKRKDIKKRLTTNEFRGKPRKEKLRLEWDDEEYEQTKRWKSNRNSRESKQKCFQQPLLFLRLYS